MLFKTPHFVVSVSAGIALLTFGLNHVAFNQQQDPAKIELAQSSAGRPILLPTNALLDKVQNGRATVTMLVGRETPDGRGRESRSRRRQSLPDLARF